MSGKGRAVLAVLAGAAVWALLWIGGTTATQAALPEIVDPEQRLDHVGVLVFFIAYSVVLSLLAGWVTAAAGGRRPMGAVWGLAVLQLALGIGFEVSAWELLPVWYHLVFLALIVPATVYGGMLKARREGGSTSFAAA